MEKSRIGGAKRRLVVAKRFTAAAAAVAFGVTFVAIRSNTAVSTAKKSSTVTNPTQATTTQSREDFFGNSSVGSPSGAAPSVSSSTS